MQQNVGNCQNLVNVVQTEILTATNTIEAKRQTYMAKIASLHQELDDSKDAAKQSHENSGIVVDKKGLGKPAVF